VLHHIFRQFFASSRIVRPVRSRRGTASRARPRVEHLEPRDLPAPLTWNAGITLPEARGGIAAAMQNGAVAVFDGSNADVPALTVSNPTWQGSYSIDAFLPAAVDGPGVGLLPDGTALVFGGQLNGTATNTATDYDYTGDGTAAAPSMSTARAFFGFATDQNKNVYAIGGVDQSGSRLSSVEYFNQDANSWTLVTSLPQALSDEPAVSDGAGHIFTFGGVDATGNITSTVYRYTISTNTWDTVASMPFGVSDSAAVLGANGLIYVLGGTTASGTTASVESYSPSSNTWNTEAPLPSPVSSEAAITDPLGRIEVIGGFDANSNPVANVWISQQLNVPDTAPVFSTPPVTQLYSWGQYQYQVLTTGNPQPTYSLTTAPTGMTIDPITGLINWFPTNNQVGNQNVTIQASNYGGATTQSFTISLVAPTLPATTPPNATALTAYSFTVPSTGNPTPTFSLVSGPAGMYMRQPSDGTVYWTPTLAQGGPQTFTVQASNYVGQVTQTYTVDVVSNIPLNVTAAGASTTSVTVSWLAVDDPAGATYDVYQRIGHIHGGYTDYLVASGVAGTSATIGGLKESGPGSAGYTYVVRATDNATGVQSPDSLPATSQTLYPPDLVGVSVNGAYVSIVQAQQGVPVQAQILWYANEAPEFSLVSGPSTMSVDPSTGIVTYTPGPHDLGTIQATVQATNSVGSATEVITYNVVANPNAPVLTLPLNQTVAATSAAGATDAAAFTATASDPQGLATTITYAVGNTPITSSYTFPFGTTTVTVTATDTAGNSSSGNFTVLVQDSTATAVSADSNPAVFGQPVTLTATVSAAPPGSGTPTGTVTFRDGTTVLGTSPVDAMGHAALAAMTFSAGSHSITASYGGDTNFTASASGTFTETINPAGTTTSLTWASGSGSPSVYGQPVTFTATVTANSPSTVTPTGSVTFYRDGTAIGTVSLSGANASFTTAYSTPGTHSFFAGMVANANFQTSQSATLSQTVNAAPTTTVLTWASGSSSPSVYGQPVTFSVTVTANSPSVATPIGSVTFYRDGAAIGTKTLSGGRATLSTTYTTVGSHSFTASYAGNASFVASSDSTGVSQTVNPAGTTTAITWASGSSSPSVYGQPITFVATVTANAPSVVTPSGSVTFYRDGVSIGTVSLSGGHASISTTYTTVGMHTFSASLFASTSFQASASSTLSQTVNKAPTSTSLTARPGSPNPSTVGQAVTFVATVTANSPSVVTVTGSVRFYSDGTTVLGTVTLSSGSASLTTSALPAGSHTIAAIYLGNGGFITSTSNGYTQVVNPSGAAPVAAAALGPVSSANPVLVVNTPLPHSGGGTFHGDAPTRAPVVASLGSTSRSLALTAAVSELEALAGLDARRLDKFFQALGLD
jgi:hypothetical protein